MSSKERPTLGGTRIKTRKRNIAAPLDPAAFADAVVQIYLDNAGDLELIAKSLESADLNFSRYGDTFFEVVFTGGRTQPGTTKPDEGERHPYSIIDYSCSPWSFLRKMRGRSWQFSQHLLSPRSYQRGKVEENLLDFFPSAKRSPEGFSEHFTKEGLVPLVEYNEKKIFEVKLKDMKSALTTQITEEVDISEVIETVKQRVKDAKLPDIEVVRILWDVIMDAVQWSGKNQQQNANAALRQVKTWATLLNTFCTNGKLELELMYKVQMQCYEDAKLMKLFPEIVRSLYDQDVLAEDTILHWFRKGTNPKGRQTFVKALESFVNWLEEAEEEE
ncbi:hypothetical protein CMV_011571 [Castanea mollissima]|uniref:W2 domain-containing protein n=1 Tax=Castanea mollissima TaxID=60419 RepID=A0A8J4VNP4_9ROSI|nr:hypothetical protein CMV_011571 [Castanea mollissima]